LPLRALQSTYRHPCTRTSHRIRKNSQITLHGEKRVDTSRRATEEDPSPEWTGAIDVMQWSPTFLSPRSLTSAFMTGKIYL